MSNRQDDLHNKGEKDASRRSEHAGIADDLVFGIAGRDAYYNPPDDKEGRDAYNKGWHNAKK
jgi:hypothetical protein